MGLCDRLVARAAREIGKYGLEMLAPSSRAELLEAQTNQMVTVVAVGDRAIGFYAPSTGLIYRAETLLEKEPDTIAWINGFTDGAVFWDIGANAGVYTLYAAVLRRSIVVAFEPGSGNFYALTRNIQLNDLGRRVSAYCVAFSASTQLGVLNLPSAAMGGACNQFGKVGEMSRYADSASPQAIESVIAFTVDAFVACFDPPFPNHLKLDVDGLEAGILAGAAVTLRDRRLESILVELGVADDEEKRSAVALLRDAGFHCVSLGEVQGIREKCVNHLFHRLDA
jgi:FkbM family methyltransferase